MKRGGLWGGAYEFSGEALRNLTESSSALDFGVVAGFPMVKLTTEYAYVPVEFGLLGMLSNDFLANGHLFMVALKGPVPGLDALGWFVQQYVAEDVLNTKVGISLKVGYP